MATIMVVDDEESMRELVKAIFLEEGFQVITASSGQECLNILASERPDVILMDMMMPGMSGRETTEKIRKNPATKNLKVAFLTVLRLSEIGKDTMQRLHVVDYITKPFDNDDLVEKVNRIIG
jgi:CheY-like chemotaxis protein